MSEEPLPKKRFRLLVFVIVCIVVIAVPVVYNDIRTFGWLW